MDKTKPPKKSTTVFLIMCTLLLSLALFGCGLYSLYISIGFRFLNRSAVVGINTASLYTYQNSAYTTGSGTMIGLILISIIMLGLGIGMVIIFFKQLPLYKQIRFIAKMPNVKYKDYSKQAKKSVIVWSIIAYIICIVFSIFSIIVLYRSGVSANYLWIIATAYFIVLALSIASMILMFVKIAQLSKIKTTLQKNDYKNEIIEKTLSSKEFIKVEKPAETEPAKVEKPTQTEQIPVVVSQSEQLSAINQTTAPIIVEKPKPTISERLFTDGIFELSDQLQKLREIHVSGLISNEEYTLLREKWIDAVLAEPLFGKKKISKVKKIKNIDNLNLDENDK